MTSAQPRPAGSVRILLVEDNPGDVLLTQEAFAEGTLHPEIHVTPDADTAMAYLRDDSHPLPDLVLLDLNLSGRSGLEVLKEIKGDPDLAALPVVVLSTSSRAVDVVASYERHANSYVVKPVPMEAFERAMRSVEDFWFQTARLPEGR